MLTFNISQGQNGKPDSTIVARVGMLNDSAVRAAFVDLKHSYDLSNAALKLAREGGYKAGEGRSLTQIGAYHFNQERYDVALEYFFRAIDLLEKTDSTDLLITAYGQIIWMFLYIHNPEKAMKYIKMVNPLISKNVNRKTIAIYSLNYGQYYLVEKKYDLALTCFYYSFYLHMQSGNKLSAARLSRFIGDTWLQKKNYRASLYNYGEAVKVLMATRYFADVAIIYTRMAHAYQLLDEKEEALRYELMALKIREEIGQVEFVTLSNINVGSAYMRLNRLDEAGIYLQRGYKMANQIGKTILVESANEKLFEYMKRKKKFREAIGYYRDYTDQHLQMIMDQNKTEISILDANRMAVEAEIRNALLVQEQENRQFEMKNRKMQTFGLELLFVALLICIQFFYSLYRKNSRRKGELLNLNNRLEEEIKERRDALQKLKQSEEVYRFLAELSSDVISRLDIKHGRNYISPSSKKIYGFEPEEVMAMKNIFDLIEPDWHNEVKQQFDDMVRSKKPSRFRYIAKRKDKPSFWAESYVNPLFDELTGEMKGMISVVRDISERKKTEEAIAENARQKEILLREIHNRVKNNFAVLVSLMNMQRELIADPVFNRSLADLQLRVRTMSLVHEQLYESHGINAIPFGDYLSNLTSIVANAYQNERITIETDIDPCDLSIEMVMPLGLIVNELLTNAYKYAFPGDRRGTIRVELHHIGHQQWEMSIEDNGIGLSADFFNEKSRSMGMQIVHILIQQIEATLGIGGEHGSRFRIIFTTSNDHQNEK